MTRRLIVFRKNGLFLVSQEFNGDRAEAAGFCKGTGIKADWPEIVKLFDGADTQEAFGDAVRKAEELYGYEPYPLETLDKMPTAQEVWVMSHGNLLLAARYGDSMVKCLAEVAERYGFKSRRYFNSEYIDILAKNTDKQWCTWFSILPDSGGVRKIKGNNTDQCNIWLYDTRPDMTPEKCIEFFDELSDTLGLFGDDRLKLSTWIDPEDWQELAGVHDAYEDERYTGKKKEA